MKKIIAILLSLVMILSMTTVSWAEGTTPAASEEHSHKDWVAFDASNTGQVSSGGDLSSGNYYLTADDTLTNRLRIKNSVTVNFCLNDKVLTAAEGKAVFEVQEGGTLNLYDCGTTERYFMDAPSGSGLWVVSTEKVDDEHTITGGVITGATSAIGSKGTLNVYGGNIVGNHATNMGGGIRATAGELYIENATIAGNTSIGRGGGIHTSALSSLAIKNSSILSNTSTEKGAGIFIGTNADDVTVTMEGVTISGNVGNGTNQAGNPASQGGGVFIGSGKLSMTNCTVTNNTANNNGGGIGADGSSMELSITGGEFSGNTSGHRGGGIYFKGKTVGDTVGKLTLDGVNVSGNDSVQQGGGIYADNASVAMKNDCKVVGNASSNSEGGGLQTTNGCVKVEIADCHFEDNSAQRGGGLVLRARESDDPVNNPSIVVSNTKAINNRVTSIEGNTMTGSGGGIFVYNSAKLTGCTVTGNECDGAEDMSGVKLHSGTVTLDGVFDNITVGMHSPAEGEDKNGGPVNVTITGEVNGSVTLGAGEDSNIGAEAIVKIQAPVAKDIVFINENTTSDKTIDISVSASVGGNVVVTGDDKGNVTLTEDATVGGKVEVSGGNITVNGTVGSMNLTGGTTTIASTATVTNGVHVNGGEVTSNNPAVKLTYPSSGAYMPQGHTVTSPFTGVDKVYVDGVLVDAAHYTTYGGNIILNQKYLDGLKGGTHSVKIVFGERSATGTFTTKGTGTIQSAKTFDAGLGLYMTMAITSAAGAAFVLRKKEK